MADDKIIQHSHYKEDPLPRLEFSNLGYSAWLTKMHQIYQGEDPPEVPASISTSVDAFVNAGRWLWMCVACNSAITAEAGQPSICVECSTQGWLNVVFPSNREEIEAELLKQPGHRAHAPIRQWRPGWGMSVLEDRTARAQAAVDAGVPFPVSLSIGATRIWSVGEILTAANKNTYERTVLEDLAGRNGPVEYEGPIVIDSLTTTERDAITLTGTGGLGASGNGLVIYNSTKSVFERYENGAWREFTDLAAMTIASAAQGDVFIRDATGIQRLGAGTARQLFRTGGSGANPSWNDLVGTKIAGTTTQGSVIYEDSNGRIARLTPPTLGTGVLRTQGSNANPIWSSGIANLDVFNTVGTHTWTPPTGTRFAFAEVVGGGGGGGGGAAGIGTGVNKNGGGGGGGGGGARRLSTDQFFHILQASITLRVGAGGAGGAPNGGGGGGGNGTAGGAGGQSSFSPTGTSYRIVAAGGAAGAAGTQGGAIGAGAAGVAGGTTASGGGGGGAGVDVNSGGTNGGAGGGTSGPTAAGGAGGTSTNVQGSAGTAGPNGAGSGGGGGYNTGGVTGNNGSVGGGPGGGGGGGSGCGGYIPAPQAGGGQAGAAGEVRVWSW